MHTCPLCKKEFNVRELGYAGLFTSYRICPNCDGRIIADSDTRSRQYIFIVISVISLVVTALLYFYGNKWLLPALATYLVMGVYLWWATTRVYFVRYEKNDDTN